MDTRVTVAAEWIFQAGVQLFKTVNEDVPEDYAKATKPGDLYQGRAGLCTERWQFWRMRFSGISSQLGEEAREAAASATEMMAKIESPKEGALGISQT